MTARGCVRVSLRSLTLLFAPAFVAFGQATCPTTGEQKLAVLQLDFQSIPFANGWYTQQEWRDIFFSTSARSFAGYYREVSYGRTWFAGDVIGPIPMGRTYSYDANGRNEALSAAIQIAGASIDFRQYSRLLILFPISGTTWYGYGGGCMMVESPTGNFPAGVVFLAVGVGSKRTPDNIIYQATHEFGHNFGPHHAAALDFSPRVLGAPGVIGTFTVGGDPFTIM
jgi:hypothetical protein